MAMSLAHLAFLYNQAGDHAHSMAAIRRALALNPAANDVAALAGAYLTEGGLADEAVRLLGSYARGGEPDVDVLIAYGVALATVGRPKDALDVFARARAVDPANGMPLADSGTVYLMARRSRPRGGGVQRGADGRSDPGARAQRPRRDRRRTQELRIGTRALAPRGRARSARLEALFNLGDLLINIGRPTEARPYWERYLAALEQPGQDVSDRARVTPLVIQSAVGSFV